MMEDPVPLLIEGELLYDKLEEASGPERLL